MTMTRRGLTPSCSLGPQVSSLFSIDTTVWKNTLSSSVWPLMLAFLGGGECSFQRGNDFVVGLGGKRIKLHPSVEEVARLPLTWVGFDFLFGGSIRSLQCGKNIIK